MVTVDKEVIKKNEGKLLAYRERKKRERELAEAEFAASYIENGGVDNENSAGIIGRREIRDNPGVDEVTK